MNRFVVAIALAALLAGCAAESGIGVSSPTRVPTVRPRSTATISIVAPKHGSTITGSTVRVRVRLEGGRVVSKASSSLTPDTGHIHISLDGETVTLLAGLVFEITDVKPGTHLIEAEFVANDHGPFNPAVKAVSTVTVE